ncbi:hypothetical protein [Meiothermus cerbereus]|uniref:hypothetical protein n=1 Tax=Meiothermus cerbereus TaxID=65552 RepID=UPI000480D28B|nr:hypothetical protein [Meiothermus cerbereus]
MSSPPDSRRACHAEFQNRRTAHEQRHAPPPKDGSPDRQEARARLRQAAQRFDQESLNWVQQHPNETLLLALLVGWLLARYPRLRRVLGRLLADCPAR